MTISTPVYATREAVREAVDFKDALFSNARIDRALEASARTVEGDLKRRFYPEVATRKFDWPNYSLSATWELDLGDNEVIEVVSLTAGGNTIPVADIKLRRGDDKSEPPYNRIEIDLSTSSAFSSGSTFQQAIEVEALYGYQNTTTPAGATAQLINGSVTSLQVTDSGSVGVGAIMKIDNERILVTNKSMLDTTQNLQTSLDARQNSESVVVQNGAAFFVDEIILIDAERMKIVDIAGNTLIVKRAWDGTTLAAHTAPTADIYAPRTLTIVRAFLGTTAASHSSATAIVCQSFPGLVTEYSLALALADTRLGSASYVPETFDNKALRDLCEKAYSAYGRKLRTGAI